MTEARSTKVYLLRDPNTFEIRYIGITLQELACRLSAHINESRRGTNSYKCNWIRQLGKHGLKPIIELIEVTEDWKTREVFWIDYYRSVNAPLTNQCDGGQGSQGFRLTTEQRNKISIATRGKTKTKEHVEKVAATHRGKQRSAETRAKISAQAKGRLLDEGRKEKLRLASSQPKSREHRKKISDALKGRKATAQQLKNMAARQTVGAKHSETTRLKMSMSHKDVPRSQEAKDKIRAGLIRYWEQRRLKEK